MASMFLDQTYKTERVDRFSIPNYKERIIRGTDK